MPRPRVQQTSGWGDKETRRRFDPPLQFIIAATCRSGIALRKADSRVRGPIHIHLVLF